jgi:hypothetical protein
VENEAKILQIPGMMVETWRCWNCYWRRKARIIPRGLDIAYFGF